MTGFSRYWNRRSFLQGGSLLGLLSAFPGGGRAAAALSARAGQDSSEVYTRLGLRPIINAAGTYTHLGGSLMPRRLWRPWSMPDGTIRRSGISRERWVSVSPS